MDSESKSQFEQRLFDQYFQSLVRLANARLDLRYQRTGDGEDIALSALGSLLGRFGEESQARLRQEDSLWPLVATIAHRKVFNHIRHQNQLKRGQGNVRGDSIFAGPGTADAGFQSLPATDPTPDTIAASSETVNALLGRLPSELSTIAIRKLEGFTNVEIATELDCSVATIERRLKMIRSIWEQDSSTFPS